MDQHQYLFGFESSLQDNFDWILAAQISLHGEEAITLSNLKLSKVPKAETDSFKDRIEDEMREYLHRRPYLSQNLSAQFFPELRNLVRFVLSKKLDLKRFCRATSAVNFICGLDDQKFEVIVGNADVRIKKYFEEKYYVELEAKNLTGPFFQLVSFHLRSESNGEKTSPILSLELFLN